MRPGMLQDLQPGDIAFDGGAGIIGALIRRGTTSPWAHCFVLVEQVSDTEWTTHEAYPGGLKERRRDSSTIGHAIRIAHTQHQRASLLATSHALVGSRYGYGELLRIVAHYMWRHKWVLAIVAIASAVTGNTLALTVATALLTAGVLSLTRFDNPKAVICSNHCTQAALAARPDLADWLRFPPKMVWPGELHTTLLRHQLGTPKQLKEPAQP